MKRFILVLKVCGVVCLLAGCVSAEARKTLKLSQEMLDVNNLMITWNEAKNAGRTTLEGNWLYKDENSSTKWAFSGNSYLQTVELFDTPANRDEFAKLGVPFATSTAITYGTIAVTDSTLKMIPLVVEQDGARAGLPESVRPRLEYDYSIDGSELAIFQDGQPFFSLIKQ